MTTFSIPDELGKRLADFAAKECLSKNEYVVQLLEEILEDREDYLVALEQSERFEKGIEKPRPFLELVEEYEKEHGATSLDH